MSVIIRKNAETMPDDEWNRFAAALNEFKLSGGYDLMTQHHAQAMATLTPWFAGETGTKRNVAHRGPAFFPWHREALRELELELCAIQANLFPFDELVGIPYWRWNVNNTTWAAAAIWNRVGGDGDPNNGYVVTTGPFSWWTSTIITRTGFRPRAGIIRRFRTTTAMPSWGGTNIANFDTSPWNEKSSNSTSFRRFFETKHNTVHTNVGGDLLAPTSPNDPVFWLHHCNVDRAWARWQSARGVQNFQPNGEGPLGHNFSDVPIFLDSATATPPKTNGDTMDWLNFDFPGEGFAYDTLIP